MMPAVGFTRATLTAGATCTEYVRAGRGGTVLLLLEWEPEDAFPLELVGALGQYCRVIAPRWSVSPPGLTDQLEEFLEGLGVAQAAVVAGDAFCDAVVEYAASAGRITRVVLLAAGDPVGVQTGATERLGGSGVDALVLPAPSEIDAEFLAAQLQNFLR